MTWQDLLIAMVQVTFCFALLPAARKDTPKPPLATSVPTAIGLLLIAFAMATLSLVFSAVTAGVSACLWALIAARSPVDPARRKS